MTVNFFNLATFFLLFAAGAALTILLTPIIRGFASSAGIVSTTRYGSYEKVRIPLLGGIAIAVSFFTITLLVWTVVSPHENILVKHLYGLAIGSGILLFGGYLDDRLRLPPKIQVIFPCLAAIAVIASGIDISYITNPIFPDRLIYLTAYEKTLFYLNGIPYKLVLPGDFITFIWLLVAMYATKLNDGLDGLVTGVSFITALFIFLVSWFLLKELDLALLSAIFAGSLLGFYFFNRYPASIYLGEGGSLFAGFILGTFAILSDAKIVMTSLILAIPIVDVLLTITRRIKKGVPPWRGDELHLHHRLIALGMSQRQAVFIIFGFTAVFGMLVFLWQSSFKYYFAGFIILVAAMTGVFIWRVYKKT